VQNPALVLVKFHAMDGCKCTEQPVILTGFTRRPKADASPVTAWGGDRCGCSLCTTSAQQGSLTFCSFMFMILLSRHLPESSEIWCERDHERIVLNHDTYSSHRINPGKQGQRVQVTMTMLQVCKINPSPLLNSDFKI